MTRLLSNLPKWKIKSVRLLVSVLFLSNNLWETWNFDVGKCCVRTLLDFQYLRLNPSIAHLSVVEALVIAMRHCNLQTVSVSNNKRRALRTSRCIAVATSLISRISSVLCWSSLESFHCGQTADWQSINLRFHPFTTDGFISVRIQTCLTSSMINHINYLTEIAHRWTFFFEYQVIMKYLFCGTSFSGTLMVFSFLFFFGED